MALFWIITGFILGYFASKISSQYKDVDGLSNCCSSSVVERTEKYCLNCSEKCKVKKYGNE